VRCPHRCREQNREGPTVTDEGLSAPLRDRPCSASDVTERPSAARGVSGDVRLVLVGLLEHLDRPATIRGTELVHSRGHMAAHGHL
jgi:hypothetical protein